MNQTQILSMLAALGLSTIGAACGGGVDIETGSTTGSSTGTGTGTGGSSTTGTGMSGTTTTGTGMGGTMSTTGTGMGGTTTTGTGMGGTMTTTGTGMSGAGGGAICPGFGDLCTACLSSGCPETYCNCYNNPSCLALIQCTNTCNGDPACTQTCEEQHQSGISDLVLLTSCAGTTCGQQCPNSGGMPIDPCNTCLLTECEDATNACLVEPECSALYQCLASCPELDLSCQQGCYADHGDGTSSLQALLQCSSMKCVMACQ